jgi:hypothetical protein
MARSVCLAFSLDWYSSNSAMICRRLAAAPRRRPRVVVQIVGHRTGAAMFWRWDLRARAMT